MKSLYLVPCCGLKKTSSSLAADMYQSQLFKKMKQFVGSHDWGILSAKYGFVQSDTIIEPYDLSLNTCAEKYKREWSTQVYQSLIKLYPSRDKKIIILAGKEYRKYLMQMLQGYYSVVEVPMQGLGIGQQLAYLTRHNEINNRRIN
jgi:cytoplasmic iron level regulating protein YaaA (DUF328/UPF0246 family)